MTNLSDLSNYFLSIAIQNFDIKHTEKECHFIKRSLDDILLDMRSEDLYFPLLNLEPWDFDFTDSDSDNLQKNRHIAFSVILQLSDKENATEKFECWEKSENIGDEILVKILFDKSERHPFLSDFKISDTKAIPFENRKDGLIGFRYEISLSNLRNNDINPSKWQLQ